MSSWGDGWGSPDCESNCALMRWPQIWPEGEKQDLHFKFHANQLSVEIKINLSRYDSHFWNIFMLTWSRVMSGDRQFRDERNWITCQTYLSNLKGILHLSNDLFCWMVTKMPYINLLFSICEERFDWWLVKVTFFVLGGN